MLLFRSGGNGLPRPPEEEPNKNIIDSKLRDRIAIAAMQGMISTLSNVNEPIYYNIIAKDSYDMADAMIKQREL